MKQLPSSHESTGLPGKPLKPESDLFRQLRESQDRLRMALEGANIGVFDWDVARGRVIYLHPQSIGESGGLLEQEVADSHWFETSHPEDIPSARDRVDRAIRGETDGFSMQYRMRRSDSPAGEWAVLHSRGRVLERDPSGRATRVLGVYEDITTLVAREEHDRQRDEHLARSTRIASLSELASSLAHEINQPLATLTTYLQTGLRALKAQALSTADLLEILQHSERQAETVAEIVKRLRTLYRSGQSVEEIFDLSGCFAEVFPLLDREIKELHIRVETLSTFKRGWMRGDRLQIQQVFYNLIRNAVDALQDRGRGAGRIRVSLKRQAKRFIVTIEDNGPGIPESVRDRLFEPFFTTKAKGTGLGLSISRTILEAHRGRIMLDPSTRTGTRFILDLPASPRPVP